MEGVGVYVATIHDKNAFKQFQIKPWSFFLVFDPILLYVFSLTFGIWSINKIIFLNLNAWVQSSAVF